MIAVEKRNIKNSEMNNNMEDIEEIETIVKPRLLKKKPIKTKKNAKKKAVKKTKKTKKCSRK